MNTPLKHIALIRKNGNQEAEAFSSMLVFWLEQRGVRVTSVTYLADLGEQNIPADADLLLVLGGDGTIISVARVMAGTGIPLAGVNFGRVGFLAELNTENWEEGLLVALSGAMRVESRLTLLYRIERQGAVIFSGEVVNDVVLTRGKLARLVNLELLVDDTAFADLRSDGLIISTPNGSTGYACSAGGALLHLKIPAYIIAAICPFLSHFPPMVLDSATTLQIRLNDVGPSVYATLDGQVSIPLKSGDILFVHGEHGRVFFADMGVSSYYERLRKAGLISSFKGGSDL